MVLAALALTFAGFIVGLGAVTVIDLHGFLGRKSPYWTEATTRTHRVTKPLIWLGTALYAAGLWLGAGAAFSVSWLQWVALAVLVANGLFLTFRVSPFLLRREAEGRAAELLPISWQAAITVSFLVSVAGWWGSLALLLVDLAGELQ
jgi:hypothetical protein